MKKSIYTAALLAILVAVSSCSKKYDDYPEPSETLTGAVTDAFKSGPIQGEAGESGMRIKLEELSWSETPTPYYFFAKQDGTFNNTKIFKGQYRISVEGPFVPLIQYDATGNVTVDNSKIIDVSGLTSVDFQVEPFLNVEWISEPVYNSDEGTISVQARFTRGTENTAFHANVSDIFFFLNSNPYVGNNNYDNRYSNQVTYSDTAGNDLVGETITITTKDRLPTNRTYYLRIGARVDYGLKYYNYSDIKTITVP